MAEERQLNSRQLLFIDEYIKDLNASQAAIRAGYSEETASQIGYQLLQKTSVSERISELQAQVAQRNGITQDWIVNNLRTVAERCMQVAPVLNRKGEHVKVETPTGELVPAYSFNAMGANKALELLGKTTGLFSDKLDVNITKRNINITIDLYADERPTAELASEAEDGLLKLGN